MFFFWISQNLAKNKLGTAKFQLTVKNFTINWTQKNKLLVVRTVMVCQPRLSCTLAHFLIFSSIYRNFLVTHIKQLLLLSKNRLKLDQPVSIPYCKIVNLSKLVNHQKNEYCKQLQPKLASPENSEINISVTQSCKRLHSSSLIYNIVK